MSAAIWGELAIDPTTDETAIRRAYAKRLKLCRPEEDAAGFRRLRAAYEAALNLAQQAPASVLFTRPDAGAASPPPSPAPIRGLAAQPPPDAASDCGPRRPAGGDSTPYPSPETAFQPPPQPLPEVLAADAMQRGDLRAAAALLLHARGDSTIPLGPWMRLTDRLALRLATDKAVPDCEVRDIAAQFGWHRRDEKGAAPPVRALRARLDALAWLDGVRASARRWTRFIGNENAAAAAALLGHGRLTISWLMPPVFQFRVLLSGLQAQGPWAEAGLDAARLKHVRALVADGREQRLRRFAALWIVGLAFAATRQFPLTIAAPLLLWRINDRWFRVVTAGCLLAAVPPALPWMREDGTALYSGFVITGLVLWLMVWGAMRLAANLRQRPRRAVGSLGLFLARIAVGGAAAAVVFGVTGDSNQARAAFFIGVVGSALVTRMWIRK